MLFGRNASFRLVLAPLALALALALAGCGRDGESAETAVTRTIPEGPAFEQATVVIETDRRAVEVDGEVAESPAQREFGLMYRESLAPEAGMVFLFEKDVQGGFWMKNTLIPLSIAFFDRRGKILRIMGMEPCREDPCPVYDPGVAYRGALEVNQGAFERWGVSRGNVVQVQR